jgi:CRP/FNR family transcriptional regulator
MSEPESAAAALARVPLFADLAENQLRFLAERAVLFRFGDGEVIFSEGDPCKGLYCVQSGAVKIFKTAASGREQVLTVEKPPSLVAELPVFDGGPYPASASVVGDSALLFVSKNDFRALCLEHPEVALKVLRSVGRRLRALVSLIEELSFTTVRNRLAGFLLKLAESEGKKTDRGIEFPLVVSNQELASHIGTVRELVSRNLSRFQAEGLFRVEGKNVVVPDIEKLREALEPD